MWRIYVAVWKSHKESVPSPTNFHNHNFRIGASNVRSMYEICRAGQMAAQTEHCKFIILVLRETR